MRIVKSSRPTCATCPFWVPQDDDDKPDEHEGECRKNPRILADSLSMFLAMYMSGKDGVKYDSPFESSEEAGRIWERFNGEVSDRCNWKFPTHAASDWCGDHPDFAKWLQESRQ